MKRRPVLPAPLEHVEQSLFFQRVDLHVEYRHAAILAVPNGGHRHKATAAKLKREGVRAGVPDILVLEPRPCYAGLCIEMKRRGNKPTALQLAWHEKLRRRTYRVEVCYSAEEAFAVLSNYLDAA